MEGLDYWRLCEELNIVQGSLLIVGEDPSCAEYVGWDAETRPKGYEAVKNAICIGVENFIRYERECNVLKKKASDLEFQYGDDSDMLLKVRSKLLHYRNRSIEGSIVPVSEYDINMTDMGSVNGTIDVYRSTVNVDSLKRWLKFKGFTTGFFFPKPIETMDFLDPLHARYAHKLAAAVAAWQAVTNPGNRTPKQALEKWLREHAAELGLTNNEGNPVETAIEECSKVANWDMKGGATRTPS